MKKDKKEKKIKKQKVELLIKLLDIENQIKKSNKVENNKIERIYYMHGEIIKLKICIAINRAINGIKIGDL